MTEILDDSKRARLDPINDNSSTRSPMAEYRTSNSAIVGHQDCKPSGGNQIRPCYFSVGTESDDGYSDKEDETSIVDRLDFTCLRVRGRDAQTERLHKIYNFVCRRGLGRKINKHKGEASVAIVGGSSGTGKSTLVKQFMEELREKCGLPGGPCMPFFIDGKYDELAGADPFSGIVDAFNGFVKDLMEGDVQELERIRNCIQRQLGSEATTLTAVIPGLKSVIQDETMMKGSRENARNKLKYIFQTFVSAISTERRPVIMFLDDLQWCDAASLELILALLTDLDIRYFMFIGSYRTDEVAKDDDLLKCFEVVNNIQPMERFDMTNLSKEQLNSLVFEALQRDEEGDTMALTEVIYKRTLGNIFHSIQVLEELQRKEVLSFSRLTFQWEWDLEDVDVENLLSEDVIQAVTDKIANAHPDLQRILVLAAYTRSGVDVNTLAQLTVITGPPILPDDLLKMLDEAVVKGLLTNNVGSRYYSFGHDRIQEAAYRMIPPGRDRDDLRLRLGLKLYEMGMADHGEEWILFSAADHLNATSLQVKNDDPAFLIKVNLEVADRASSVAAYQYAIKYLGMAKQLLLRMNNPWDDHYDITLRVYRATAEAELCLGHFDVGKAVGQHVISRARCLEDKMPTYLAICRAVGREERHKEAYEMSVDILRTMGAIPKRCIGLKLSLIKDFVCVKRYFARHSDTDILDLPILENKRLETVIELLSVASYHAYYCDAVLDFLTCISRMLVLSIKNGHSPCCGVAMMGYSLFCNALNDMEGAHRFSHLARDILTKTQARELECLQIFVVTHFVYAWKDPADDIIELYEKAHKVGMESGDFENALLSQTSSYHHAFVAGRSLAALEMKYSSVIEKLNLYNIQSVRGIAGEQLLPIRYLRGTSKQPFDPTFLAKLGPSGKADDSSENFRLIYGYMGRLQLAVYFNDDDFALHNLRELSLLADTDTGFSMKSVRKCFSSLAYATLYRKRRKLCYLTKSRRYLRQLKSICQSKGTTCWHRCMLMEAHLQAAEGRNATAIRAAYDHAIGAALRNGCNHDAALGSQLAAEYCLSVMEQNPEDSVYFKTMELSVRHYIEQARQHYLSWGAIALINHLERQHHGFFDQCYGAALNAAELLSVNPSLGSSRSDTDPLLASLRSKTSDNQRRYADDTKEDISVLTM